ncbi:response regulator transcription factor [Caldilinea sp.]|uniref:response regulator transcription factor n=1 Tax=Caldilinea sp. TaxID=2293560 RepID=UPI002C5DD605|nr:response regulator transcription factor [Caldilinea sp.]HRA65574.1 response regulator transcription factor [Caldilinea sp.]
MAALTVTILVIEDDRQIRRVVQGYLAQAGYRVLTASDGETGLALAQHEKPALIVLDLMLPGLDGWEITRRLRQSSDPAVANVHILMLTARVEEGDRVRGLALGADDYVIKPFSPRELVARVQAALRRLQRLPNAATAQVLVQDALRLDPTYRNATLNDTDAELTAVEFDILYTLMRQPGRPFTRDELLTVIQKSDNSSAFAYERTVDAHIKNLRHKLGGAGRHSRFIETVHGVGYRFAP